MAREGEFINLTEQCEGFSEGKMCVCYSILSLGYKKVCIHVFEHYCAHVCLSVGVCLYASRFSFL